MDVKMIDAWATKTAPYNNGVYIKQIKGVMLHSVGVAQPNAEVLVKNHSIASATVVPHGFLDGNGNFYQLLEWEKRAWCAGSAYKGGPSANDTHLQIEMTEPSQIQYYNNGTALKFIDKTAAEEFIKTQYMYAVQLFAKVCAQFRLNPLEDGVVISHKEGNERKIASAHVDPEHLWNVFGLTMDSFRADVYAAMGEWLESAEERKYYVMSSNAYDFGKALDVLDKVNEAEIGEFILVEDTDDSETFSPYVVKVTVSTLNIRSGPGLEYSKVGSVKKGEAYTVVEEKRNGSEAWGRLKSGAGWILLSATERV